ncbi:MAG: hypothetical protein DWQ36_13800 [Acidobacteria bacterium]|nr:MAG: hypothetical protein DWQ30_20155 [Acidobacteriota bacterium]REK06282.1 MAG: hypothetical protein DWQ36_13800 [Acidobacteriota bacterium]
MTTHYLNTDLVIDSEDDLTPIVEELGEDVVCLYNGPWGTRQLAAFEIVGHDMDASSCIRAFCGLVEALSPKAREVWDRCSRRSFDIGFEAGLDRESCERAIDLDALEMAVSVRARLVVTVYPPSAIHPETEVGPSSSLPVSRGPR